MHDHYTRHEDEYVRHCIAQCVPTTFRRRRISDAAQLRTLASEPREGRDAPELGTASPVSNGGLDA